MHLGHPHPPNRSPSILPSHATTLKIYCLQQRSLVLRRSSPSTARSTSLQPITHRDLPACCHTNTHSTCYCRSHLPPRRHIASIPSQKTPYTLLVKIVATTTFYKMQHHSIHFIHLYTDITYTDTIHIISYNTRLSHKCTESKDPKTFIPQNPNSRNSSDRHHAGENRHY